MIKYSFLIPFYNRTKEFRIALSSYAYWYGGREDFEIIIGRDVKDDRSNPEFESLLSQYASLNIRIIETGSVECFMPGPTFNVLARQARGFMLILTNPETVHCSNILDAIDLHWPNPDNPDHPFYLVFACEAGTVSNFNQSCPYFSYEHFMWYQHSQHNNRMLHFCSAIARETYLQIGGFDEAYAEGIGYDDNDFIEKIRSIGIPNKAVDEARVVHIEHDRSYNNSFEKTERNKQIFIKKWGREP